MKIRAAFAFQVVVSIVALAGGVSAQNKDADRLFDEATKAFKDGNYSEACPKFEQSNKLDPGVGVQLWLANCYEKAGKIASAYRQYLAAEQLAIQVKDKDQRDKVAHKHATDLEPRLAKLTIALPPSTVAGLVVKRDGEVVKNAGEAEAIDPGSHLIEATAPGYKPWQSKVDVGDGSNTSITVAIEKEASDQGETKSPIEASSPSFWTPMRIAGAIVAGAGVVGLGVGAAFGVMAKGNLDDSNAGNHCDAADTCDSIGLQLRSDAQGNALASTISFVAGGVLAAGGITLMIIGGPKKTESSPAPGASIVPTFSSSFAGLAARGQF